MTTPMNEQLYALRRQARELSADIKDLELRAKSLRGGVDEYELQEELLEEAEQKRAELAALEQEITTLKAEPTADLDEKSQNLTPEDVKAHTSADLSEQVIPPNKNPAYLKAREELIEQGFLQNNGAPEQGLTENTALPSGRGDH